ncbi:leucine-rich repeat domain-containing protein [Sutcliffiella deserti]|uniref:leucine-rich repeat domain-containing protein n=1 Tax=Sutcliffiella deserti TaxID=2875501 RepID=UPI001CBE5082|nr:leucine-rich repeat domain-containing protein [Sutcliffiella deserti]
MKLAKLIPVFFLLLPLLLLWGFTFQVAPKGIYFADERLEEAVRIVIEEDGLITQDQLKTVETLSVRAADIDNIEGLHFLTELKSLDLRDNNISDLTPLQNLTGLVDLNLRGNSISDLSSLKRLTQIRTLNVRENQIEDISVLANLSYLEDLNIRYNQIESIDPLQDLEYLTKRLFLEGNKINDYSPIDHYYPSIVEKDF